MPYVTLLEASQIVHRETGVDITVPQLIRAGAVQNLPLCVLLDVKCYSPTHRIKREKKAEELDPDYSLNCPVDSVNDADVVYAYGLFVLPPRHVFQYQTQETVRVNSVSSLDGQDTYYPGVDVSRDALQIMLPHLSAFIAHIKATQSAQQQTAPASDAETPGPVVAVGELGGHEAWKEKARKHAHEIIKRDREKSLYPSQENIADEIAKKFRLDGVTGTDGKPLAGSTIKRHSLNGISSAQGKQLSTARSRGK